MLINNRDVLQKYISNNYSTAALRFRNRPIRPTAR